MNRIFETNFVVMPTDANYMYPLIFGGAFAAQIDLCAAQAVSRFLHDSECESAVTHKMEIEFLKPSYVGDLIFLRATVLDGGKKSILVEVTAEREKRGSPERDTVAFAKFVFVSVKGVEDLSHQPEKLPYHPHGLSK